jgi:hypothetical protein
VNEEIFAQRIREPDQARRSSRCGKVGTSRREHIGGQRTPCQRANWHDSAVERRGLSDVCHLEAVRWWSPSAIGNCAVRGRRSV